MRTEQDYKDKGITDEELFRGALAKQKSMPRRHCAVRNREEFKYESLEHELHTATPPESTRAAGEQGEVMANEEMLCCSCGQRVPKAIVDAVLAQRSNTVATTDRARRAAEEIAEGVSRPDCAPWIFSVLTKHFAAAPADNDAESLPTVALRGAVLTYESGSEPLVSLSFDRLQDAQEVHRWLTTLKNKPDTTTKGDR